jgi:hypothetical protein
MPADSASVDPVLKPAHVEAVPAPSPRVTPVKKPNWRHDPGF